MAKSQKEKSLQYLITNFAVEICPNVKKDKFNTAWHRLMCGIAKIGLFKDDTKNKRSK